MKLITPTHRFLAVIVGLAVLVTVVLQILHDTHRI
jgi:heme A synthase